MNRLQKITVGFIASLPLIGGCSNSKTVYPLKHLGTANVGALAAYDDNGDNFVLPREADTFARHSLFKDPENPTIKELDRLKTMADFVSGYAQQQENLKFTSESLLEVRARYVDRLQRRLDELQKKSLRNSGKVE